MTIRPHGPGRSHFLATLLVAICFAASCDDVRSTSGEAQDEERASVSPGTRADIPARFVSLPLEKLVERGIDLHYSGEYDSARVVFSALLERTIRESEVGAHAQALTWLGLGAWRRGSYEEARQLGEKALELKLREGLTEQLFMSYNALGLLAWNEARLADANDLYERAIETARAAGDEEGLAKALGNLALIQIEFGDFSQAKDNLQAMRDISRTLGMERLEGNALTNLAMLDVLLGSPHRAVERLNEARRLYRLSGYTTGEENALGQLGTAYRDLGDFSKAHAAFDSALSMARELGLPASEAMNLERLAELYGLAGDDERAMRLFEEARLINEALGDDVFAGIDARYEAETHAAIGDAALAIEKGHSALELHRRSGATFEELRDRLLLAELAAAQEAADDAARHLEGALRLANELNAAVAHTEVALTEARIADMRGDYSDVLSSLEAIRTDLAARDPALQWEAWSLAARAHFRRGELDSAVAAGRRAVEQIERVRSHVGSGALRSSYAAARATAFTDLVTVLLRKGEIGEAFQIADAARGQGLRLHLLAAEDAAGSLHPEASEAAEGETLLRRLDRLTAALDLMSTLSSEEVDDRTAQAMADRLRDLRQRYEDLVIRLSEEDSAWASALGVRPIQLEAVRAALRPNEVLLEYLVTPERVLVFVVSQDEVRVAESPITETNLRTRVRLARELISQPVPSSPSRDAILAGLYQNLIDPAARAASVYEKTTLIIVPHGVLTYLPFAALRDSVTGRYLAESFAILHLPSAASLPLLRARGPPAATLGETRLEVLAPFPENLPASLDEATGIAEDADRSSVAIGQDATEARMRRALASESIVHVATYGVLNAQNPMFSRLELARRGNGHSSDDGRLEVHEVLGLPIRSSLVYLSGCETALGRSWSTDFAEGQDYATLSQAFLYAGAANVIATLWRVEDEGAGVFARTFYRELEVSPPEEALARTQRELIADEQFASPYYWAAYRLSGSALWPGRSDGRVTLVP